MRSLFTQRRNDVQQMKFLQAASGTGTVAEPITQYSLSPVIPFTSRTNNVVLNEIMRRKRLSAAAAAASAARPVVEQGGIKTIIPFAASKSTKTTLPTPSPFIGLQTIFNSTKNPNCGSCKGSV